MTRKLVTRRTREIVTKDELGSEIYANSELISRVASFIGDEMS